MITRFHQRGNNPPDCLHSLTDVGILQRTAAIMQTDDVARFYPRNNSRCDCRRRQTPVAADDRPHNALKAEFLLHPAEAKPPDTIRCPQQARRNSRSCLYGFLRAAELVADEARGSKGAIGMA